jgi:hypothetical protein
MRMKKTPMIALNSVRTLAVTMLATERLDPQPTAVECRHWRGTRAKVVDLEQVEGVRVDAEQAVRIGRQHPHRARAVHFRTVAS